MYQFMGLIWKDLLQGSGLERFMAVVMYILIIVVALLILWLVFYLVDTVGVKAHEEQVRAVDKDFTPAHNQTTMIQSGKVLVPIITRVPDHWAIIVRTNNGDHASCSVSYNMYKMIYEGSYVNGFIYSGRLSRATYCKGITIPANYKQ